MNKIFITKYVLVKGTFDVLPIFDAQTNSIVAKNTNRSLANFIRLLFVFTFLICLIGYLYWTDFYKQIWEHSFLTFIIMNLVLCLCVVIIGLGLFDICSTRIAKVANGQLLIEHNFLGYRIKSLSYAITVTHGEAWSSTIKTLRFSLERPSIAVVDGSKYFIIKISGKIDGTRVCLYFRTMDKNVLGKFVEIVQRHFSIRVIEQSSA